MPLPMDGDPLTGDPSSPEVRHLIAMLHPGEVLRPEWTDPPPCGPQDVDAPGARSHGPR